MKKRYSISFFAAIVICFTILSFAYQMSYEHAREQAALRNRQESSVPTKGTASKADNYYLKDLNGFIAVYHNDRKTIYEYTDIRMDGLPDLLADEIRKWKPIDSLENLYGFLENYSS